MPKLHNNMWRTFIWKQIHTCLGMLAFSSAPGSNIGGLLSNKQKSNWLTRCPSSRNRQSSPKSQKHRRWGRSAVEGSRGHCQSLPSKHIGPNTHCKWCCIEITHTHFLKNGFGSAMYPVWRCYSIQPCSWWRLWPWTLTTNSGWCLFLASRELPSVARAMVTSRLDYRKVLCMALPMKMWQKLQLVQNVAA